MSQNFIHNFKPISVSISILSYNIVNFYMFVAPEEVYILNEI